MSIHLLWRTHQSIEFKRLFFILVPLGYNPIPREEAIDPFSHYGTQEDIERRSKEEFNLRDYTNSCKYNKELFKKYSELSNPTQSSSLSDITNMTKLKKVDLLLFSYISFVLEYLDESENLIEIIKKIKIQSLCIVAPYTAYVFTIDSLFHQVFLPKWKQEKSLKLSSNWVDFNYLYYLPFIDILFSQDKIFNLIMESDLKEFFQGKIYIKNPKIEKVDE